jgi:hypothetical protein
MQEQNEALLGGPVDDKARQAVEEYLRKNESRLYDSLLAEFVKRLPDPMQPLREVVDAMRTTLAEYGITASNEEIASKLAEVLPPQIVAPLVEVHRVLAPRLEWAMGEILDKAQVGVDQLRDSVLAPIEARLREIFHAVFTAVTKKAAELIGRLVEAAVNKLLEILKPLFARLIAALMTAVITAVGMVLTAMLEIVNAIGRVVFKFARAVAMWIAKKLAMFFTKLVLRLFCFLFGIPAWQMEISWMETEALIHI